MEVAVQYNSPTVCIYMHTCRLSYIMVNVSRNQLLHVHVRTYMYLPMLLNMFLHVCGLKGKEKEKLLNYTPTRVPYFSILPFYHSYSCFSQLPNYPAGHFLVSRPAEMPLIWRYIFVQLSFIAFRRIKNRF